jgi:hypothetical protein
VTLDEVAGPASITASIFAQDKSRAAESKGLDPQNYEDYGKSLGADDAFWDGTSIQCHAGPFWFTVSGVNAQLTTDAAVEWRDKVLTMVVGTLSAKMT